MDAGGGNQVRVSLIVKMLDLFADQEAKRSRVTSMLASKLVEGQVVKGTHQQNKVPNMDLCLKTTTY